jgi:hypothetical protein
LAAEQQFPSPDISPEPFTKITREFSSAMSRKPAEARFHVANPAGSSLSKIIERILNFGSAENTWTLKEEEWHSISNKQT